MQKATKLTYMYRNCYYRTKKKSMITNCIHTQIHIFITCTVQYQMSHLSFVFANQFRFIIALQLHILSFTLFCLTFTQSAGTYWCDGVSPNRLDIASILPIETDNRIDRFLLLLVRAFYYFHHFVAHMTWRTYLSMCIAFSIKYVHFSIYLFRYFFFCIDHDYEHH